MVPLTLTLTLGAPIIAKYLDRPPENSRLPPGSRPRAAPGSRALWKKLEAVQDLALSWVFSSRGKLPVFRSLTGLGLLRDHFQQVTAWFSRRLSYELPGDHPLTTLSGAAASQKAFHVRCRSHPLRAVIDGSVGSPNGMAVIKRRFAEIRLGALASTSVLANRIGFDCRRLGTYADACLHVNDPKIRDLAIKWRSGGYTRLSTCSVCLGHFSPRHVRECSLLPDALADLDVLLNECDYESFSFAMEALRSKLVR